MAKQMATAKMAKRVTILAMAKIAKMAMAIGHCQDGTKETRP